MPTRILIVEDSRTQAEALRALLEDAGYDVLVAADGVEGLATVGSARPDIVLTDIVMPGPVDGYELCRRIKRLEGPDTPVVLLTSLSDPMDIIGGLECGADNFFTKPYEPDHLLARLKTLLATREARARPQRGKVQMGVKILFMGRQFTVTSERAQILDLLITTFEDAVRQNRELRQREAELTQAKGELAKYLQVATGERQAAEERYRRIFEDATFGLFQTLPDGTVIAANPALTRLLGYESPAALASGAINLALAHFVDPDKRTELYRLLDTREFVSGFEVQLRRTDSSLVWGRLSARAVRDSQGVDHHHEGIIEDVTEAKLIERQFLQAQKMEGIGRLAGGIAHDFNNLLTVILASIELTYKSLLPEDPLRPDLDNMRHAAERAAALTRQLLSFARRQIVEPRVIDVNALALKVDSMLRRLIGEDISLHTRRAPNLGAVRADPGQLEQVIVNLVVNARDAMPDGGKLTIETANVTLDQAYARSHLGASAGDYVMVAVSDTGHGFSEEIRQHLFEPFFTTKAEGKGTGLGLATCYGIVKQCGGTIWAYSEVGVGSTFKVYLPRVGAEPELLAPTDTSAPLGGHETILLVEDEPMVRDVTARTLVASGYRVLRASNGVDALRLIETEGPAQIDLLVTDVVMPEMGGLQLLDRLRGMRPGLRVLFTSGYAPTAVVRHGVLEASTAFLPKPFVPDALVRKVREVLDAAVSAG